MNLRIPMITLLASGTLSCVGGCLMGPNYTPPATTMPARYVELRSPNIASSSDDPEVDESRWWTRFEDPQLAWLVESAIKANRSVAVAEARLREARAGREMVQSLLSPQVGVGASALRFRGSRSAMDVPDGMLDLEGNVFQLGFDAAWTVDLFGGIRRGVESARATEEAIASQRRGVVLMVAAETARAYIELRGVQRELQVARANLEDQRKTFAVTEDRRKNGLASDLEVVRARTEVEATRAEIPLLEQAIRQYIHVLSTLLALEPTSLGDELEQFTAIPAAPSRIAAGIPSDLLRRRPDVQSAERQLASATAMVGVATADLFPKVVLGGSAGLASRDAGDLFNGNGNDSSSYYAVGPHVNWTLFDGGRRKAGIKLAEAQVAAAKAAYEDIVLRAFREVESALVAVDRSHARVEDLKRLAASAREAADIAAHDYERGILDQLTVLDAQRQAHRADMLLTQGQIALNVNVVKLYKALGGGWEVAEPAPATGPAPTNQSAKQTSGEGRKL